MEQASVAHARGYEEKVLKAIASPIRLEIMRILEERVASPNQIRKELKKPLGLISHHIRTLQELDCIELVETRQVRGSTEHFYRPRLRSNVCDSVSEFLPQEVREGITDTLLKNIFGHIQQAVQGQTIDLRTDRHISWMKVDLDPEGWRELIALKAEQLDREMALQAKAAERLSESGERPIKVLTCNVGVELPYRLGDLPSD